jgi:hypothetical protein
MAVHAIAGTAIHHHRKRGQQRRGLTVASLRNERYVLLVRFGRRAELSTDR